MTRKTSKIEATAAEVQSSIERGYSLCKGYFEGAKEKEDWKNKPALGDIGTTEWHQHLQGIIDGNTLSIGELAIRSFCTALPVKREYEEVGGTRLSTPDDLNMGTLFQDAARNHLYLSNLVRTNVYIKHACMHLQHAVNECGSIDESKDVIGCEKGTEDLRESFLLCAGALNAVHTNQRELGLSGEGIDINAFNNIAQGLTDDFYTKLKKDGFSNLEKVADPYVRLLTSSLNSVERAIKKQDRLVFNTSNFLIDSMDDVLEKTLPQAEASRKLKNNFIDILRLTNPKRASQLIDPNSDAWFLSTFANVFSPNTGSFAVVSKPNHHASVMHPTRLKLSVQPK